MADRRRCGQNDVKRSTGIPRSFMIPCDASDKGAYKTPDGGYGRPVVEA